MSPGTGVHGRRDRARPRSGRRSWTRLVVAVAALVAALAIPIGDPATPSGAIFTDTSTSGASVTTLTLNAPTGLKTVRSGANAILTWTPTTSTRATGYIVLRSDSPYGPWEEIKALPGIATKTYTDTSAGTGSWIYRVESTLHNFESVSAGFQAPPPVGLNFYDTFTGSPGPMNGRRTEDGSSTWQAWAGVPYTNEIDAYNFNAPNGRAIAVVRTSAHDATLFGSDFDGYESLILRGKDPKNYIIAGGTGVSGEFGVIEVRNGVERRIATAKPGSNQNIRVTIEGSTIKAYTGAHRTNLTQGTLLLTANSTYLQADSNATYFGLGIISAYVPAFSFNALG